MIIFLFGPDSYRRNQNVKKLIEEYQQKHPSMDFLVADLEDEPDNWEKVRDFLNQPSMFTDAKLVVAKESGAVDKKEWRAILKEQIKTEKTFVLISDRGKPAADFKFLKEKAFKSEEFGELSGRALETFAKKESARRGLNFSPDGWRFFLDYLENQPGERSWLVITELEKITLSNFRQPIELADLKTVIYWFSKSDFYSLIRPLLGFPLRLVGDEASGDGRTKLGVLEKLFLQKEEPARIFNTLAYMAPGRQLEKLADYDVAVKSGRLDYEEAILDFALE